MISDRRPFTMKLLHASLSLTLTVFASACTVAPGEDAESGEAAAVRKVPVERPPPPPSYKLASLEGVEIAFTHDLALANAADNQMATAMFTRGPWFGIGRGCTLQHPTSAGELPVIEQGSRYLTTTAKAMRDAKGDVVKILISLRETTPGAPAATALALSCNNDGLTLELLVHNVCDSLAMGYSPYPATLPKAATIDLRGNCQPVP